ncbi:MAG TPA: glycosyltransferase family 1 protein, partial [Aggregatilineales bacterium]|nr:glycosyltransferase family 1 protein [Aggregatilineales bacterium]
RDTNLSAFTIGIDVRLTYYRHGGIAEYMRQLVSGLAEIRSDNRFLTLHNFRAVETLAPGSNFQRVNCYTPAHHRLESLALGTELLPRRLDLLHNPDFIPPRFGAKRYVITVHDLAFLLFEDIQTASSLRYYAGGIRRAVKQADCIISVSHATKNDLMRLLDVPENKIRVIWEGIHPQYQEMDKNIVAERLRAHGFPALDDYILFVGTIEPRKNIPNLIRACTLLRQKYGITKKLLLVGQHGWLVEESLKAIDDSPFRDDIILTGAVAYEDLPVLYNGAGLHILPSLYEGFAFPALEAMACGTPTIVSDRGALREITGDAALLVNPDDPESITDAMYQLLTDSDLRFLQREKGLQHVRQFTWRKTAESTLAVYHEVLA